MKEQVGLMKRERPSQLGGLAEPTQSHYGPFPYEEDERMGFTSLPEYWGAVRHHLGLVLGILALITSGTALYMSGQPNVYQALARVQVDQESAGNPALGAVKGGSITLSSGQDPAYFNTQVQILTSASLLGRVVRTFDLKHNEAFLNPDSHPKRGGMHKLARMVGIESKSEVPQRPKDDTTLTPGSLVPDIAPNDINEIERLAPYVAMLQDNLTVKPLNDTRIVEIRFRHADPEMASKVTNAIADTFVLSNLERKTETNSTAMEFLLKRIGELQSAIRKGEEQLINYAKGHEMISLDANQNTVVERLAGLNQQLLEAENERKAAEAAFRVGAAPDALAARTEANANIAAVEAKLAEFKQRRAQLLLDYTEKYPEVKTLDQQIAMLEQQVNELSINSQRMVKTSLETRYQEALHKEQSLREAFDQQRSQTVKQNEAAVNYKIIQQEIETNKSLLDGLLQRSKENEVVLAGTSNNIHVLDYAPIPKSPIGPKRFQFTILGFLFAVIVGVALARYLEYLDDSVKSAEDVERFLHLPTLGVIPAVGSLNVRRLMPKLTVLQRRGDDKNDALLIDQDKGSPFSEAYRHLRTSLLLSSAGGAPQMLLVTSSQPAEGKTTTAVNTALILAQTGSRVLVIDADMRKQGQRPILGLERDIGLSNLLSSKMSETEMLGSIQTHEGSGLYVLPSGTIPPNPAELIGSEQMRRLLDVLRSTFTHIIIDSPPIASFTDGVLMSSMADGVLLVVQGGRTSRAVVRRARQSLSDVGAKIFGVVLNNVNLTHQDYYYRFYDQKRYYERETKRLSVLSRTGTGD